MADALEMTDDRHACFTLYAFDQAFSAARHDHIDTVRHLGKHVAHRGAIRRGNELDAAVRQARGVESLFEAGVDRAT